MITINHQIKLETVSARQLANTIVIHFASQLVPCESHNVCISQFNKCAYNPLLILKALLN